MESPRRAIPAGPGWPGRANREIAVPSARRRGRVIHAHRYPYGMMVRGRNTAEAVPAGLAAVTVLIGPVSARMAGRQRRQTPPATTPVVAGDKPDFRPRPARLAPAPALVQ